MSTKPQRKRMTAEQLKAQGRSMAGAVTVLVAKAVGQERRRNRWHFAALWLAVAVAAVMGVVL